MAVCKKYYLFNCLIVNTYLYSRGVFTGFMLMLGHGRGNQSIPIYTFF